MANNLYERNNYEKSNYIHRGAGATDKVHA